MSKDARAGSRFLRDEGGGIFLQILANSLHLVTNFLRLTFQITLPRFADYTENMEADSKDCERHDSERRPLMH